MQHDITKYSLITLIIVLSTQTYGATKEIPRTFVEEREINPTLQQKALAALSSEQKQKIRSIQNLFKEFEQYTLPTLLVKPSINALSNLKTVLIDAQQKTMLITTIGAIDKTEETIDLSIMLKRVQQQVWEPLVEKGRSLTFEQRSTINLLLQKYITGLEKKLSKIDTEFEQKSIELVLNLLTFIRNQIDPSKQQQPLEQSTPGTQSPAKPSKPQTTQPSSESLVLTVEQWNNKPENKKNKITSADTQRFYEAQSKELIKKIQDIAAKENIDSLKAMEGTVNAFINNMWNLMNFVTSSTGISQKELAKHIASALTTFTKWYPGIAEMDLNAQENFKAQLQTINKELLAITDAHDKATKFGIHYAKNYGTAVAQAYIEALSLAYSHALNERLRNLSL
ncbi:MAG: hypothetical protein UU47_C0015G0010 [candidate division TM6 bacterium GW2011_GWE2_41_16]|nr:MAG: hypothetical protein UU47_C0015G0010 [candidate division TM6 bacterium GW2011_GWE2_41_16]